METKTVEQNCPCVKRDCGRHANCRACMAFHRTKGGPTACGAMLERKGQPLCPCKS